MTQPITGIILTAGLGSRLGAATADRPKGLVEVSGFPLLSFNVCFLRACGVDRIIAVAGFHADKVRSYLGKAHPEVLVLENPDYRKGNLYSFKAALPHIKGSFLLSNADHVYRLPIAEMVRKQCEGVTAFCDFDRTLGDDDMKIKRAGSGALSQIAKTLTDFDGGYVGLTYCDTDSRAAYAEAFARVEAREGDKAVVEQVLGDLAANGSAVRVGDISGVGWLEIDFPEEFSRAQAVIAVDPAAFGIG
jgi:choline kinase